jgi:hypothetical protein
VRRCLNREQKPALLRRRGREETSG